jgi:hypothetical protein
MLGADGPGAPWWNCSSCSTHSVTETVLPVPAFKSSVHEPLIVVFRNHVGHEHTAVHGIDITESAQPSAIRAPAARDLVNYQTHLY